jgi:predicted 3-demethylubiquinone-9 3-methyltransferase (glyoxalase superfamily)
MDEMMKDSESPGAQRAMAAMLQMKKIDMNEIQRAYEGR